MKVKHSDWIGIDYGSKLAGTTVIAFEDFGEIDFIQSEKKKDADQFILDFISANSYFKIFLDAPLSLPIVYSNPQLGDNYFYRKADMALKAMSPMFLGGLTARAMKLQALAGKRNLAFSNQSFNEPVNFIETYPSALRKELFPNTVNYHKKNLASLNPFMTELLIKFPFKLKQNPVNWHQVDALLAWWSGFRFHENKHKTFGDKEEGQIVF